MNSRPGACRLPSTKAKWPSMLPAGCRWWVQLWYTKSGWPVCVCVWVGVGVGGGAGDEEGRGRRGGGGEGGGCGACPLRLRAGGQCSMAADC